MKKKVTCWEITYLSMVFMTLTTLFQGYISIANQILVLLVTAAMFCSAFYDGVQKKKIVIIMIVAFCCMIAFSRGQLAGHIYGLRRLLNFPFLVFVYFAIVWQKKKCLIFFKKKKRWVDYILKLWLLAVGISIFIPNCYDKTQGWGSFKYFYSFTKEGGARLGSVTLLVMAILLAQMAVHQQKRYFYWFLIPMYSIIMCGSRIYLAMGMIEFMIAFWFYLDNKKKFWLLAIPVVVLLLIIAMNSSLGAKLESTRYTEYSIHNVYDTVSNGRFTPIVVGVNNFKEESWARKLIGNGYGFIEDETHNWAFNDVVDLGLVFGIIGLIVYFICIHKADKMLCKSYLPWYMKLAQWGCWFLVAMFGMYYRMTATVIAIPFSYFACYVWKREKNEEICERVDTL